MRSARIFALACALVLAPDSDALMFRSASVIAHWDTWGFYDDVGQSYWAFALITEISPGEGFLAASSKDGVHWTDHGYVFHKPGSTPPGSFEKQVCPGSTLPDGSPAVCSGWQGTGAVWRSADFNKTKKWVVNFSQCPNKGDPGAGGQNISVISLVVRVGFTLTVLLVVRPASQFATSTDMIHWEWLKEDWFEIDTTHYT